MPEKSNDREKKGYGVLGKLLDVKLFGGMVPNEARVIGSIQCEWGVSLHPVKIETTTLTSAFKSGVNKGQGAMGKKHFIPYGLYVSGFQYSSTRDDRFKEFVGEGLNVDDMKLFEESLLYGSSEGRTATKGFIEPIAIVKVVKSKEVKSRYDFLNEGVSVGRLGDHILSHKDLSMDTKILRKTLKKECYDRVEVFVKEGMGDKYKDLRYLKRGRGDLSVKEEDLDKGWEYVVIYEVKQSNPNGDPDMDNMPRRWEGTDIGIISPERQKRWIRDYIEDKGELIFITRKGKVQKAKERMKEIEDLI